ALARPRGRPRGYRRVRPDRACDRGCRVATRRRRADLLWRIRLHDPRVARDRPAALARPAEEHVRGRELPDPQRRLPDVDCDADHAHRGQGVEALPAAGADDLDGRLGLGDAPDRGVADDAPAPAWRDSDRADDDPAAGPPRDASRRDHMTEAAIPLLEL